MSAQQAVLERPEASRDQALRRYSEVRGLTTNLCETLEPEDFVVQTMEDVSPTKWHLAHTSWFFETFVIKPLDASYRPPHPRYPYLFNSYYVQAGERHCRPKRGLLSRPTVQEILDYRRHVDEAFERALVSMSQSEFRKYWPIIEIGLNHEQQHQELLLTDIKHVLSVNPLEPVYREAPGIAGLRLDARWVAFEDGIYHIGHDKADFHYDNEGPRHRVFLEPFSLQSRPVTVADYLEFIRDGGYQRAELWLSEGWAAVEREGWYAPEYWEELEGEWTHFTLNGMRAIDPTEPVTHVSYFEADAFARWAGHRLPTEFEWEVASRQQAIEGNFVESNRFHPSPLSERDADSKLARVFGDSWEWTLSHYSPYPGYKPVEGAIGEYNGKFMCNQFVLRGGSCATSRSHMRHSYRNFFPADARWQFSGIRLAKTDK